MVRKKNTLYLIKCENFVKIGYKTQSLRDHRKDNFVLVLKIPFATEAFLIKNITYF